MHSRRCSSLCALALCVSSLPAFAQAKLEKAPAPGGDAAVPAAIRSALDPTGAKLVGPDGSVLCQIWLRKSLPVGKVAAVRGAAYPEMAESTLVGVIQFPGSGSDFRGQTIRPGFYTMRYEQLPEDGNHMGVAPTRDFVLLLPASTDVDPTTAYDFAQLVKLSAQVAGTNHPAAFVLLATDTGDVPRTYQSPDGFQVFAGAVKTQDGKPVPIALVVKGQAEQ